MSSGDFLNNTLKFLYSTSIILNSVFIVILLIAIYRVLAVLPLKYFDKNAKIVMAAIVFTMCIQLLGTIFVLASDDNPNQNIAVDNAKNVMDIMNMVGDMTIWLIFFFFVYEVKSVIVILSSSKMHEMSQALKRTQREKYIVVSVTFFLSIIYHGIAAIMLTMREKF
jgi:hypothetical protein